MKWDELDLEAAEPDQDEEAPAEQEAVELDADEPDQETDDLVEDAAEESGEGTADSDSEESDEEEASDLEDDEAGTEDDISEEVEQPADVVTISGNAIIFPEEYDLTAFSSSTEDTDAVVQAVDEQTNVQRSGFFAVVLLLGIIVGLLFVHGFRLRRV